MSQTPTAPVPYVSLDTYRVMKQASCVRCHLRLDVCICAIAPQLNLPLRITVIMHPKEWGKAHNTARLLSLAGVADIVFWQRGANNRLGLGLSEDCSVPVALLYPADPALSQTIVTAVSWLSGEVEHTSTASQGNIDSRPQIIVLDGTWQQTRKMFNQSRLLQELPLLVLPPIQQSDYPLRKHQLVGCGATVEAVIELLLQTQLSDSADMLRNYFQCFLRHYEAHRSGHNKID